MQDKIMETAKLTKRDPLLVKSTIHEIVDKSKNAIAEDAKRLEELEKNTTKAATKKERKEVLIEYNKVKRLNATTMVERPAEMALIRNTVDQAHDKKMFRIGEAMKPAQDFTCNWGGREDGMLMVGIAKYGWGSWWDIRDDPELDMKDKCFLEEQRTANKESRKEGGEAAEVKARKPTQVHLNRRANYLVSVLKAKASGDLDSLENHHRNIKKSTIPDGASVPGMPRRIDKPRHRAHSGVNHGHSVARDRTGTPDVRYSSHQRPTHSLAHRPDSSSHRHSDQSLKRRHDGGHHDGHKRPRTSDVNGSANHHRQPQSSSSHKKKGPRDEFADKRTQELMQPIMASLSSLTESTRGTTLDKKEKVRRIKEYTLKIGDWIDQQEESKRDRYWEYVGHRCFSGSSASSMRAIFVKMDGERQTALAGAGNGATPTPAPPTPAAKQSSATPAVATPVLRPASGTPMGGVVPTPTPAPAATNGSANGSKSVEPVDIKMEEANGNGNGVKVETAPLPQAATASS
jgi:chromodomain-helicase-DNA-binding protein 1